MKKILILALTACILLSGIVFADTIPENVEIKFSVGDNILQINGNDISVVAPYVVGEGTTLVPLRVITEAFGADVKWDENTRTITLQYPEVYISMQIDNIIVTVNDHTETMLAPPEIKDDRTMVPLRFISETFGADVSYDEITRYITVIKNANPQNSSLLKSTDLSRVGDSYYNWSMNTPRDMIMEDRSFDGTFTVFTENEDQYIMIIVSKLAEDESFDKVFSETKDSMQGKTLLKADKLTDEFGNRYMNISAKDKTNCLDYYCYFTADYRYDIHAFVTLGKNDTALQYAQSFKLSFDDENKTHDLSNVNENNLRPFTDEKYKVSLNIPADYLDASGDAENVFYFVSENGYITLEIYSKQGDVSARSLAKKDLAGNTKYINGDYITYSPVEPRRINSSIYGYGYILNETEDKNLYIHKDLFFEVGDYVYNIGCKVKAEDEAIFDKVLDSVQADDLNYSEIGVLLRNDADNEDDQQYTEKIYELSYTLPLSWQKIAGNDISSTYLHKHTNTTFSAIIPTKNIINPTRYERSVELFADEIIKDKNYRLDGGTTTKIIGSAEYKVLNFWISENNIVKRHATYYICMRSKKVYMFAYTCDVVYNSTALRNEVENIIKSASFQY